MPTKPRKGLTPGIVLALLAAVIGIYASAKHLTPAPASAGCEARAGKTTLALDAQQAAIAATIAGVAHQRAMPAHAVEVAYAAAMQESHLHNLRYGDRDSVGVFQQRPSAGWGPARKLLDPVYASTRFFEVLATVPGYAHLPVYQAAQAVQRSADGSAYMRYQPMAAHLTAAFTGRTARAVWCWSTGLDPARTDLVAAHQDLVSTFGPVSGHRSATPGDAPTMVVRARPATLGWAVATWLVTHAHTYGIHTVRYAGYTWQASAGRAGWTPDKHPLPGGRVAAS